MKNLIILSIILIGFASQAQVKKWTLKECVAHALENNISVKQSELDVELADVEKLTAVGSFLPSVNASANVSNNTGLNFDPTTGNAFTDTYLSGSGGVSLGYTLFDGLQNFRNVQRAKISKLAAQFRLTKMKDDISLFVANNYLQVILNKANLEVLRSQNEVTLEQLKRTEELVDAGMLPQGDVLEIRATNATEKQSIVVAENNIQVSLISLAQLLLIKDYQNFDIQDEGYDVVESGIAEKSVYEIIENAKETRAEVKIAETNVELAAKDVQIAKGSLYPTLSAFFGYDTRYSEANPPFRPLIDQLYLNDGIGYGLRINIPVLNGFSAKAGVQRSKINLENTKYQLEQAKLDLETTVYQAYVDAKGALKAYEAAQSALESQELAFEYAQERYDVGLTNAFDFSQSKVRFDNAKIELNRTKYDYIFKLKVIELYFGIPVDQLKF